MRPHSKRRKLAEGLAFRPPPLPDDAIQAGQELRKLLIGLFCENHVSAKTLCLIAYYTTKGRGSGVTDLSMHPDRVSDSNFSAHLKLALSKEFDDPEVHLEAKSREDDIKYLK